MPGAAKVWMTGSLADSMSWRETTESRFAVTDWLCCRLSSACWFEAWLNMITDSVPKPHLITAITNFVLGMLWWNVTTMGTLEIGCWNCELYNNFKGFSGYRHTSIWVNVDHCVLCDCHVSLLLLLFYAQTGSQQTIWLLFRNATLSSAVSSPTSSVNYIKCRWIYLVLVKAKIAQYQVLHIPCAQVC